MEYAAEVDGGIPARPLKFSRKKEVRSRQKSRIRDCTVLNFGAGGGRRWLRVVTL